MPPVCALLISRADNVSFFRAPTSASALHFSFISRTPHYSAVYGSLLTGKQDGSSLGQPRESVGWEGEAGRLRRGYRRRLLMPHVVHDDAPGQRQRQLRERRYPRMRRRRHQGGDLRGGGRRGSGLLRRARRFPGAGVTEQTFPRAAVEHRLDVLPGVHHFVRRAAGQLHVPPPGVEVGRVRLHVLVRLADAVRVEDEFVRRVEQAAVRALDALGARAVVTGG